MCTFLLESRQLSHHFIVHVAKGVLQKVHLISPRPSLIPWGLPLRTEVGSHYLAHRPLCPASALASAPSVSVLALGAPTPEGPFQLLEGSRLLGPWPGGLQTV